MTVSSTVNRSEYSGNGTTTAFSFPYYFLADGDLTVILVSSTGVRTTQIITTHFTIAGAGVAAGGTVNMVTAPATGETLVILREVALTQGTDFVENDPLPAEVLEQTLDRVTMIAQQHKDIIDRTIKFDSAVTDAGDVEIVATAAARANKLFAFDASGDLDATQEIGVFQGNWVASTAYVVRDLIKDTSNSNVYICITAHTSSGSQPISSNTDVAKWTMIVDAATATSSSTAAATSATAAATSATNALASKNSATQSATTSSTQAGISTAQAVISTAQAVISTTKAGDSATSATASSGSATASSNSAAASLASKNSAATSETNALSSKNSAATSETNANTSKVAAASSSTSAASSSTSAASSSTSAASSSASAVTAKTAAETAQAAAEAALDEFTDQYLGAKSSDPTVDNDGSALTAGDMYFNTGTDRMRVYSGSAWADVAIDSATVVSKTSTTGSGVLPASTTANRDGSPTAGYIRFNTTDTSFEGYDGSAWGAIGGGATGGGADTVFWNNGQTVTTSYSVPANTNSMSAGPTITINSSVVITIPSSSHWTIV